jgi:xanthine dehydrogenase accessory factor
MHELQDMLSLALRARSRGEQLYLATVIHVEGSSYRKPGARMLVTSGGERAGTISGGCLEAEVSRKIAWLTAEGGRVERYRSSLEDDYSEVPYGLGCGGTIWVLMETGQAVVAVLDAMQRAWAGANLCIVVALLGGHQIGTALIVEAATGQELFRSTAVNDWSSTTSESPVDSIALRDGRVFSAVERSSDGLPVLVCMPMKPAPGVTVFGAGNDAQPLVRFASEVGWRVTVADGRNHLLARARFPEADALQLLSYAQGENSSGRGLVVTNGSALKKSRFSVILTHSYEQDRAILGELLPAKLEYLGILGPLHRTERLVNALASSLGMTPSECLRQLHAPVGLNFGSDDPAVIALSIISEMQGALSGTRGLLERRYDGRPPAEVGQSTLQLAALHRPAVR